MGRSIILNYIKQNPEINTLDLKNVYIYYKFKAYLQTTLKETKKAYCIKKWKAAGKISYMTPYDLCILSDSKVEIEINSSGNDIEWAIKQLEPSQAEVIKLSFFSDMTDSEISSMKHVTRQSVNAIKHRALKKLKDILGNNE